MRTWYKYFLSQDVSQKFIPKDETFEDHKRSMQGYDGLKGYSSKEEFFRTYFYNAHTRHRDYHDFLTKNLDKGAEILSIGSGRCVNELLLAEDGFNITCSDLDQPCRDQTVGIFRDLKFVRYDATSGPTPLKYNCIISLSMFYLFDRGQLERVFENIAKSLKPGGLFLLDPGGAEDNPTTWVIDNVICPIESGAVKFLLGIIKKKRYAVTKKHQGYRTTNGEIVSAAAKAGFELCGVKQYDNLTEFRRSRLFEKLPDAIVGALGRGAPYIRMFKFKKNG